MNYYVIRKTCTTLRSSTYYGISWPASQLRQDPLGLKLMYEPREAPLSQSMVLLFPKWDMAHMFAKMILVHYGLTNEMPTRDIAPDLRHDAWAWTSDALCAITDKDFDREGFSIEELPMAHIAEIGIRTGITFAEIEFPDDYTAIRPPQRYGIQQIVMPRVQGQTSFWRKHLHQSWMISGAQDLDI